MSAPTIQTPLTWEDAVKLAQPICPGPAHFACLCEDIAAALQAVDVASRAQANAAAAKRLEEVGSADCPAHGPILAANEISGLLAWIKQSFYLCAHGYIGTTCGLCFRDSIQSAALLLERQR